MARFGISEIIFYYDGIQLAIVYNFDCDDADELFLTCQSITDSVFLATRMSPTQLISFKKNEIDAKTIMTNPYMGDIYILIDPSIGSSYIQTTTYSEFYGFKVDHLNQAFLSWVIPDADLFYDDTQ